MTQAAKTSLGLLALAGVEPYELKKRRRIYE
ncbi:Uncharacterised protein [Mannheimia haemolytica]|nr:Uncharacterised protein [Mannheimia haemolytica]